MVAPVSLVIPTVGARASELLRTVRQWQALGFAPRVVLTNPDWPPSPVVHGIVARQVIRATLATSPTRPVLFCEDDVDISWHLPDRLSALLARTEAVTLYLPGRAFYPRQTLDMIDHGETTPMTVPVRNLKSWFGSQCLLLPTDVAAGAVEMVIPEGFDTILRAWLIAHRRPLYAAVPNLAQHRAPPSVTSPRYQSHRSISFVD